MKIGNEKIYENRKDMFTYMVAKLFSIYKQVL